MKNLADFRISNGSLERYTGLGGDVIIPKGVTKIGYFAFSRRENLTSVTIPDSVTRIGRSAFSGCINLISVTISNSVIEIGDHAFEDCAGLINVIIPNSVTGIGNYAFTGCVGLTRVTIPDGVTKIGDHAFAGCTGMTSVTIPDGVTRIGDHAFEGCTGLTSVTIPGSVTRIGNYAFEGCANLTDVTISDGVSKVGEHAFEGCAGLTSMIIPDSVIKVGAYAFKGCMGLNDVTIPGCMNEISDHVFEGCIGLTDVTIPDGVTTIEDYAFEGCGKLMSITIPNSVTSIGDWTFENTKWLESQSDEFVIVNGILLKYNGSAQNIRVPDLVTSICGGAFSRCENLISVTISQNVKLNYLAFPYDIIFTLGEIPILIKRGEDSNYLNALIQKALNGDPITSEFLQTARFRESMDPGYVYLCRQGHTDCLAYVKKNIMRLARSAIDRVCIAELNEFVGYGFVTKSNIGNLIKYALDHKNKNTELILYLLDLKDKNGKFRLEDYDRYLEMAQGDTELTAWLLEHKNASFSAEIIDQIEWDKMDKALGLKERTLAEWKNIFTLKKNDEGEYIIAGYRGEETDCVVIPASIAKKKVTAIGEYAFSPGRERLTNKIKEIREKISSVVIPDSVTSIGHGAFSGCKKLAEVTLSNSVTSIESYTFCDCEGLTSITLPDSIVSVEDKAFFNCKKLASIHIPASVTNIGASAFRNCQSLTSISLSGSATSIGASAFESCQSLASITAPRTAKLPASAFSYDMFFTLNDVPIFIKWNEDKRFLNGLLQKAVSGKTITAEFLQMAQYRESRDPVYVYLCRHGQEDCFPYVKKNILKFTRSAIDRACIAELKEFESYGFITKTNASELADYALEQGSNNEEIIQYLLGLKENATE